MEIERLVDECIILEREKNRLLWAIIALSDQTAWIILSNPLLSKALGKEFGLEISKEKIAELRGEYKGGIDEASQRFQSVRENYDQKLSELAEIMEEEEFELNTFESELSQDQFLWLSSRVRELKEHLKGIEIL